MHILDIIDKLILFLLSLTIYIQILGTTDILSLLIIVLAALTCAALLAYTNKAFFHHSIIFAYFLFCLWSPAALFFLPVIVYTWFFSYSHWLHLLTLILLSTAYPPYGLVTFFVLCSMTLVTALIKYRTYTISNQTIRYRSLEDHARELNYTLKHQHQELLKSQDSEIYHATLNERHRIAREIHDHVGHVLSRALLQIGAILAINKDTTLTEHLNALRVTLNQGMDNIRSSVHDLHDTSIDIEASIRKIIADFTFCPIHMDIHITSAMHQAIKFAVIAIVKESLNNIIKHSTATQVTLRLREHYAFYQLVISDNGHVTDVDLDQGIGLRNIFERIEKLGGHLNIDTDNGFQLFITLPREEPTTHD